MKVQVARRLLKQDIKKEFENFLKKYKGKVIDVVHLYRVVYPQFRREMEKGWKIQSVSFFIETEKTGKDIKKDFERVISKLAKKYKFKIDKIQRYSNKEFYVRLIQLYKRRR